MIYGNKLLKETVYPWVKYEIEDNAIKSLKFPYTFTNGDWKLFVEDILKCVISENELSKMLNDLMKKEKSGQSLEGYMDKMYPDILFNTSKCTNIKKYFGENLSKNEFSKKFRDMISKTDFAKDYNYQTDIMFQNKDEGKEFFLKTYKSLDYICRLYEYVLDKKGFLLLSKQLSSLYNTADRFNATNQKDQDCKQTIAIAREARSMARSLDNFNSNGKSHDHIWEYYRKLVLNFDYFTRED